MPWLRRFLQFCLCFWRIGKNSCETSFIYLWLISSFFDGSLVSTRSLLMFGMLASSITAFAISYSTAWSMRVNTSTSYSMVGALNKLPVALSGMIFFSRERHLINSWNIVSIILAFSSGIIYSIAMNMRKGYTQLRVGEEQKIPLKALLKI